MSTEYIAHIDSNGNKQSLIDHAVSVANISKDFTEKTLGKDWASISYVIGLLHDFGKYQEAFQRYIQSPIDTQKAPHSGVGANLAINNLSHISPKLANIIAYCISGHHRGLYNHDDMVDRLSFTTDEKVRLKNSISDSGIEGANILSEVESILKDKEHLLSEVHQQDYQLLVRILFSSLVDADFLDTERFMDNGRSDLRATVNADVEFWNDLSEKLQHKLSTFDNNSPINKTRTLFLEQCVEKGCLDGDGIYSLYLPTGGGKTLSSMAWAIEKAKVSKSSHIIYVIPYTSIISQTVDVFKSIFGKDNVLEHHSNIDFQGDDVSEIYEKNRLLSENWDVPIIVTTNVQFFESLFSNRTSRTRKLHNICDSVIVFDEVQTFPTQLLNPMLRTIESLNRLCGVSMLLCTATQPIFGEKIDTSHYQVDNYKSIEQEINEVVPYDEELFSVFDRVDYNIIRDDVTLDTLALRIKEEDSTLCIVNTRKDAAELAQKLKEIDSSEVIHLSRMMCAEHIRDKINIVKQKLQEKQTVKVISTQLIEAGVDIDFPVVYRALSGLDSIIQAGGRCNRDGKQPTNGKLYVFNVVGSKAKGNLLTAINTTKAITSNNHNSINPNSPELIKTYYTKYFSGVGDFDGYRLKNKLWGKRSKSFEFEFEESSNLFKYIEDKDQESILVPYKQEGVELIDRIKTQKFICKEDVRIMQKYTVRLYHRDVLELKKYGRVTPIEINNKVDDIIYLLTDVDSYTDLLGVTSHNHFLTDDLLV